MAGLAITVDADFGSTGWGTPDVLARQEFVQGATNAHIYDPSIRRSLFQDREGLIPVQNIGDPVMRINDRSGQGRDMILSAISTGTPTWQTDGQRFWIENPLKCSWQADSPQTHAMKKTVVGAFRADGLAGGIEGNLLSQSDPVQGSSLFANHTFLVSRALSINLDTNAGMELKGKTLSWGEDFVYVHQRDPAVSEASLWVNDEDVVETTYTMPAGGTLVFQYMTMFGNVTTISANSFVRGRLYYFAFVNDLKEFAAIQAIARRRSGLT